MVIAFPVLTRYFLFLYAILHPAELSYSGSFHRSLLLSVNSEAHIILFLPITFTWPDQCSHFSRDSASNDIPKMSFFLVCPSVVLKYFISITFKIVILNYIASIDS